MAPPKVPPSQQALLALCAGQSAKQAAALDGVADEAFRQRLRRWVLERGAKTREQALVGWALEQHKAGKLG